MDLDELKKRIAENELFNGGYTNTLEDTASVREILTNSYDYNEFPYFSGFEEHWRQLEEHSSHNLIDREQGILNPLDFFLLCIDSGFYPPPEVLIVMASCFKSHRISGSKSGLSDVFYGKKESPEISIDMKRFSKYMDFELNWAANRVESLQLVAEKYIDYCSKNDNKLGSEQYVDIESFLRGYRRWKKDIESSKYIKVNK